MKTVCVLGEGSWGTAIATVLAHNGYTVNLWCHDAAAAENIRATGTNQRYMPGVQLSDRIVPTTELSVALKEARWVFEAIPVQYLRSVVTAVQSQGLVKKDQTWVLLSKGIEQNTLLVPTQIIAQVIEQPLEQAVVAGPSFAGEVVRKELTAVSIAATTSAVAQELQQIIGTEYLVTMVSADLMGIQIAAALKNVIALGCGILKGAGCGDNTLALAITRGLQEIAALVVAMGGAAETVYGLAGVGDLVLTTTGMASRNLQVGLRLGKGESLESILVATGYTPEGVNTVQSIHQLMLRYNLQLPVCNSIYEVVFNRAPLGTVHNALMKIGI